jgi:uncharacterized protein (TIGR00255 family)
MIRSMTAFARVEERAEWGHAVFEIRSVNQRFLELQFKLPEVFRHLEPDLRSIATAHLSRGKVDVSLRFELSASNEPRVEINEGLAKALHHAIDRLQSITALDGQIDWVRFLQWPDMVTVETTDLTEVASSIKRLFTHAIEQLVESRRREGKALRAVLEKRLIAITDEVHKVNEQMPAIVAWQKDRIRQRFAEAGIEPDSDRLEQELVLLAQRMDVTEEMDRLITHVEEFQRVLEEGGVIGRRLDFLLQEMNREANTLGSKSINAETTSAAVELKVLIEQIREQVQNIE